MRMTPSADRRRALLWWAAALIGSGAALLVFNLGLLDRYQPMVQYGVAVLLALGSFATFVSYLRRRTTYWRLMPAWTLLALAAMLYFSTLPQVTRPLLAAVISVGLALAFANIYLISRSEHWWAIIPGGFMGVLAVVLALSTTVTRLETLGAVLLAGMGLVFFLVNLLAGARRHWWALIPGSVLVFVGILSYTVDNEMQGALLRWWPAALVVLGAGLAWFAAETPAASRVDKPQVHVAPSLSPPAAAAGVGRLGEYSQPAPGASVELLPDPDEAPPQH
jgi:hypothetical protein